MRALTTTEDFEKEAQPIISEYTDIRMQHCMLQPGFQRRVNSKYGFLYVKMLRERVMDELKITQESAIDDLQFDSMMNKQAKILKFDLEAKYNLNHVKGFGFDNLVERAAKTSAKE